MSDLDDGGLAFQVHTDLYSTGMTLRDWFAGHALAGVLADPNVEGTNMNDVAEYVFEMADAMLKAMGGAK